MSKHINPPKNNITFLQSLYPKKFIPINIKRKVCKLYFDGGCQPNPGIGTIGVVIEDVETHKRIPFKSNIGQATNNVAEFAALYAGVKLAKKHGYNILKIYGDSKLVIMAITPKWRVHNPNLSKILHKIMQELTAVEYHCGWIPREQNQSADDLTGINSKA